MSDDVGNPTRSRAGAATGPARMVLALVCAGQFMVVLDASIINVALPSVQRELGFTDTGLAWVVNGYVLAFAGFMLLGGRAADLFGHRRVLVGGIALFSLASLAAGLATNPPALVAARVAQGLGGALLAPATLAVVNTGFADGPDRARAFAAWSAAGGVGGMVGALAGGLLTTGISWRWVFLINVPVGVALVVVAMTSLTAGTVRRESLDLAGAITATAGLAAFVYGVMRTAVGVLVAGVVLLAVFLVVEKRFAPAPLLPLRLFRYRGVALGNGLLLLFGGVAVAMWFFSSLFLQNVLGYSALGAGLGQTPAAVTFVVVARLAAGRLRRTGARPLVVAGCAGFVAGFGWLSTADAGSHYLTGVLGPTLLVAAGIGLVFPTLTASATAAVGPDDAGIAGGLATTAGQVGGAVALAVYATVAGPPPHGYRPVFLLAAGVAVAIAAAGLLLPARPDRTAPTHR